MKETFFVLVLIALVLFSTNTPARSYKPDRGPTICPRTEHLFVMRGKAVVIPIRVGIRRRVEFGPQQLRDVRDEVLDITISQPRFGALSNLRHRTVSHPESRHFIGEVTYTPGNDLTSNEDRFSYFVTDPITGNRLGGGAVSILIGNASSVSEK